MTPDIEKFLEDPVTPFWVRSNMRAALHKDPVDAWKWMKVTAELLEERMAMILGLETKGESQV